MKTARSQGKHDLVAEGFGFMRADPSRPENRRINELDFLNELDLLFFLRPSLPFSLSPFFQSALPLRRIIVGTRRIF